LDKQERLSARPPDWAADTSIYHPEGKQIQKDKPAMESNTIGRYTEHMGEELPEFTGRLPRLSGTWTRPAGRERPRRGKVTIEVGFKPYLVISPIGTRLTF
jgi:hypothetical protein